MIRITSKKHLFRRCGMEHPKGPVDYPNDKFTKEQLKALKGDPMFKVEIIADEEKSKKGKAK